MKLLVGIDGAEGGRDALALARELAAGEGDATIVLGHVAAGERRPTRASNLAYDATIRADGVALLELERERTGLDTAAIEVTEAETPGIGLQHLAERTSADLVVVGTSRRRSLARILGGDDARATVRAAGVPVAVAPREHAGTEHRIARIGVGFDETPEAGAALAFARAAARRHGASIDIVEAIEVATWLVDPAVAPALASDAELRRASAQERLAALDGVHATARTGLVLSEMLALGATVDLLIVGWRPHGPVERFFEGSTGESLSHDPPCPVVVVPAPQAAG